MYAKKNPKWVFVNDLDSRLIKNPIGKSLVGFYVKGTMLTFCWAYQKKRLATELHCGKCRAQPDGFRAVWTFLFMNVPKLIQVRKTYYMCRSAPLSNCISAQWIINSIIIIFSELHTHSHTPSVSSTHFLGITEIVSPLTPPPPPSPLSAVRRQWVQPLRLETRVYLDPRRGTPFGSSARGLREHREPGIWPFCFPSPHRDSGLWGASRGAMAVFSALWVLLLCQLLTSSLAQVWLTDPRRAAPPTAAALLYSSVALNVNVCINNRSGVRCGSFYWYQRLSVVHVTVALVYICARSDLRAHHR